jgi:DNA polymerase alpha subunit A
MKSFIGGGSKGGSIGSFNNNVRKEVTESAVEDIDINKLFSAKSNSNKRTSSSFSQLNIPKMRAFKQQSQAIPSHNSQIKHEEETYNDEINNDFDCGNDDVDESNIMSSENPNISSSDILTNNAKETTPVAKKISLVGKTKSLKIEKVESNNSFGMGDDFMGQSNNQMGGSVAADSNASIDPKSWLLYEPAPEDAPKGTIGQDYVAMFWIDAVEKNGVVYVFGKLPITEEGKPQRFVSCCVTVHGCERNLFVLPRAIEGFDKDKKQLRANPADVYNEMSKLLTPAIIPKSEGSGFKSKMVTRNYAFEYGDVPREETKYLKIKYSSKYGPPSPAQCNGGKFYQRIFGTSGNALELFLLKRKLMGPCWIVIKNPRQMTSSLSWCKVEIGTEDPKNVSKYVGEQPSNPFLTSMTVSMKTAVNPMTHKHEVIALCGLVHTKVDPDRDTEQSQSLMKCFTFVRQLGQSCGNTYTSAFPHDIQSEIKKLGPSIIQTFPNERALLSMFFSKIQTEDPDIMASHNLFGFEFDVLLNRSVALKLDSWSRLGRLRRSQAPKNMNDRDFCAGRILCDTYKAAKEFLRETSYSLTSLTKSQLKMDRFEIDPIDVPKYFSSSSDIIRLANYTRADAFFVQKLLFKLQVVALTKQLTTISGNLWSRTVRGARAERIEFLLLHEFHAKKFILPERKAFENKFVPTGNDDDDEGGGNGKGVGGQQGRRKVKAGYSGGLVLEPKKGLYDTYILLLDFNSLYPSLIQEHNLCFTTVDWTKFMPDTPSAIANGASNSGSSVGKKGKKIVTKTNSSSVELHEDDIVEDDDVDSDGEVVDDTMPPLPTETDTGVLPKVIRTLVERRRQVKSQIKKERDANLLQQLDIRQKALKLTANSMYGCLGFSFSRFYARPIAALVTKMGREALQMTVKKAQDELNLDVIYGDTDSVMINTMSTDLDKVKEYGNAVINMVNKGKKYLELDRDGIFKSMLLLKKKKYAAVTITEVDGKIVEDTEMKGLDLVRRDWCPLSKETGIFVVNTILSGKPREEIVHTIHSFLHDLAIKVREQQEDNARFVITKGLNKHPKDYAGNYFY